MDDDTTPDEPWWRLFVLPDIDAADQPPRDAIAGEPPDAPPPANDGRTHQS